MNRLTCNCEIDDNDDDDNDDDNDDDIDDDDDDDGDNDEVMEDDLDFMTMMTIMLMKDNVYYDEIDEHILHIKFNHFHIYHDYDYHNGDSNYEKENTYHIKYSLQSFSYLSSQSFSYLSLQLLTHSRELPLLFMF